MEVDYEEDQEQMVELCRTDINRCKMKKWKDRPKGKKNVGVWEKSIKEARISFGLQCHLRNRTSTEESRCLAGVRDDIRNGLRSNTCLEQCRVLGQSPLYPYQRIAYSQISVLLMYYVVSICGCRRFGITYRAHLQGSGGTLLGP